ncbi:hypothetical protein NDU88_000524 [Pleurodeles waltl]|uniref:Uncharacterized protein n=1 Tax=Pleurodeles waltl TaxID=8319 RepID=A0AAV7UQ78_PLEWA|nr:hypothetical protein NDU88_000524 [Pleurodeles waltl]
MDSMLLLQKLWLFREAGELLKAPGFPDCCFIEDLWLCGLACLGYPVATGTAGEPEAGITQSCQSRTSRISHLPACISQMGLHSSPATMLDPVLPWTTHLVPQRVAPCSTPYPRTTHLRGEPCCLLPLLTVLDGNLSLKTAAVARAPLLRE